MAFPTDLPRWATAGTVVEPSEGKKDLGWIGGGEKPPFQTFNWLANNTYENLVELRRLATPYATLEDFIDDTTAGDIGYVWEPLATSGGRFSFGGDTTTIGGTAITETFALASDGRYLYIAASISSTPRLFKVDRNDPDTVVTEYSLTSVPSDISELHVNGDYVVVGYTSGGTNYLECFTAAGTQINRVVVTTTNCAIDGTHAYVVDGNDVNRLALNEFATPVTTYDHTAAVTNVIMTPDNYIIVVGVGRASNAAPLATGDTVVSVLKQNLTVGLWGVASITSGNLTGDGEAVYNLTTTDVDIYGLGNGLASRSVVVLETTGVGTGDGFAVDHGRYYVLSQGIAYAFDKRTDTAEQAFYIDPSYSDAGAVASDGDMVWAAVNDGSASIIRRWRIATATPRLWARYDGAHNGRPFRQLALPVEG